MIKNKQQLADAITTFFNSSEVQNQISEFFVKNNISNKRMSHIFGGILIYMVATREKHISSKTLNSLIEQNFGKGCFKSGELVVKSLLKQLKTTSGTVAANDVLEQFKQNFIDGGFYMHACNKAIEESVLTNGLISNATTLKKDRQVLGRYIDYEYDYRAYRLYVTSGYNSLYSYGAFSPEWLFNNIKDTDIMINRDSKLAKQTILTKAIESSCFKQDDLPQLKESINNVVNFYFNKKGFNVVIMDKSLKDKSGERVFNRYDEEEELNLQDFDANIVLEKAKRVMGFSVKDKQGAESGSDSSNSTLSDLGTIIDYLVNKYSTHELTTIQSIAPEDLAVAKIPCPTLFISEQQKEQEAERTM